MKATTFFQSLSLAIVVAFTPAIAQQEAPIAKAQPTGKVTANKPVLPTASPSGKPRINPMSVTVQLDSNTEIRGALTDTTSIDMKTSFGQVTLPLAEVAGVKMADENTATTTVVMHNGDSVTGATDIQRLTVETEWGVANINGNNVNSILLAPGLKWASDSGLNGVRWELVAVSTPSKPKSSSTASTQRRASSTTSSSSGRIISSGQPVYSGQPTYGRPIIVNGR